MTASRPLRAPQEDGAFLAVPPPGEVGELLAGSRRLLSQLPGALLGRSWADLRSLARRSALQAAQAYLADTGEPIPEVKPDSVFLAGHQPELFHPGVWVKHFALHRLAARFGATPLNLIVDNDTAKSTALRVPALATGTPHLATIPFDYWKGEVPYEERPVLDEDFFAAFPARVAEVASWPFQPLLADFWNEVLQQTRRTPLVGERLAAARRTFERRWGCHNLEVPISRLCETEGFAWFACHLLSELPRFHRIYNEVVRDYRRRHHIRSRNHPVPDLAHDGDWLEAPFWAWRKGQTRRHRLFVRRADGGFALRAGQEAPISLPAPSQGPTPLVEAWRAQTMAGFKVRSRALTTTLYARLFLGDLFIHGIGGAKYDELTDEIVRRFYGFEPPRFMVLSATLLLPLPRPPIAADDCRRLAHALRDLLWNPQRHLDTAADPRARELAQEKQAWIERPVQTRPERKERFQALRRITEELRRHLGEREPNLREQLMICQQKREEVNLLRRRDYAFCLYPEELLTKFVRSENGE